MKKGIFLLTWIVLLSSISFSGSIEWSTIAAFGGSDVNNNDCYDDGGGTRTQCLFDAGGQVISTHGIGTATHKLHSGYVITIPAEPKIISDRTTETAYTTSSFQFTNAKCAGGTCGFSPDGGAQTNHAGIQYYRYAWKETYDYTNADISSGSTWSDNSNKCPGKTCTNSGSSITKDASTPGTVFLHIRSYDGGIAGKTKTYGPYYYDPDSRRLGMYPSSGTAGGTRGFLIMPILYNNIIYVGAYDGLYALNIADCSLLWTFTDSGEIQNQNGVASIPSIDPVNNKLYFSTNAGRVYRITLAGVLEEKVIINSGKKVRQALQSVSGEGKIFVGGYDTVHCRIATQLATPCPGWTTPPNLDDSDITTRPIVDPYMGYVFAASEGGHVYKINISDPTIVTTYPATGSVGKITGTPQKLYKVLYFGDHNGVVHAVSAQTMGALWTTNLGGGAALADKIEDEPFSLTTTDLYIGWNDNSTTGRVYKIVKSNGTATQINGDLGKISTTPIYCNWCTNKYVYVGSEDGRLYCIDPSTGNIVWKFQTGGRITSSPLLRDGKVIVGTNYGKVYRLNP